MSIIKQYNFIIT